MTNLKLKRILIFGTGAVGGYFGSKLVKGGFDVAFIARGKHFEILKQNGLTIISRNKIENIPIKVFESAEGLGIFDYILICVKSTDTRAVVTKIINNIDSNSCVISLQNGLGNIEILSELINPNNLILAVVLIAAQIIKPGTINHLYRNKILIGKLNKQKTKDIKELKSIFKAADVECIISEDIESDLWEKLIWNSAFNPLSALTGKTIDMLLKEDYELVNNIMNEIKQVALANGVKLKSDTIEFNIERSHGLKDFKTSMLQDLENGKPLEIESLLGEVIKKAEQKSLSVPNLKKIYNDLKTQVLS